MGAPSSDQSGPMAVLPHCLKVKSIYDSNRYGLSKSISSYTLVPGAELAGGFPSFI